MEMAFDSRTRFTVYVYTALHGESMRAGDRTFLHRMSLMAIGMFALGLAGCDPGPTVDQAQKNSGSATSSEANPADGGNAAKSVQTVDDLALNIKVEDALKENPGFQALTVKVHTVGGVVTLSGTADTAANRDLAGQIALKVSGVKSVQNKLIVAGV